MAVLRRLTASPAPEGDGTVEDLIKALVGKIGENMTLRRVARLEARGRRGGEPTFTMPKPMAWARSRCLSALEGDPGDELGDAGRKVAMHVAATAPAAARVDELDPGLVERERAVLTDEARASGKPEMSSKR